MQFAGVVPEDAPDPRIDAVARLDAVTFPVMELVPQPHLEYDGHPGFAESRDAAGVADLTVELGYTFWRNPDDRDDPANLAELDERTRDALEHEPPWPRPAWLVELAQLARFPHLSGVVRTTWNRNPSEHTTVARHLVDHANHILMNDFRAELGIEPGPTWDAPWRVTESAVNSSVVVRLDGVRVPAAEIDTDPWLYAVGVRLAPDVVATAVVHRELLPLVEVAFATRPPGGATRPAARRAGG